MIKFTVDGLYGGVTQQAAPLRLGHQVKEQVNCYSSPVAGVGTREPAKLKSKLLFTTPADAKYHDIHRDEVEQYTVVISNGTLSIYDIETGAVKTVNAPAGWSYLNIDPAFGYSAEEAFKLITLADLTIIVNRTQKVSMDARGVEYVPYPSESIPLNADRETGLPVYPELLPNPSTMNYRGISQTLQDLPDASNSQNDYWLIMGDPDNPNAAYYVRYDQGAWKETAKPGLAHRIDLYSMPHALKREADGTFTFAPIAWAQRLVGDDKSNPMPFFVNGYVEDAFVWKNRLCFVSGELLIFSEAGDFSNFWRKTVVQLLDTAPFPIRMPSADVANVAHATPFRTGVYLSSTDKQFMLATDKALTPRAVAIDVATKYEVNRKASPVIMGDSIYAAASSGQFAKILEFQVVGDTMALQANDLTIQCPRYLPADIVQLVADSNSGKMFVRVGSDPKTLYLYESLWSGQERVQSAWSKLVFSFDIKHLSVKNGELFILGAGGDGLAMYSMSLELGHEANLSAAPVMLDKAHIPTTYYNSLGDYTVVTSEVSLDTSRVAIIDTQTGLPIPPFTVIDDKTFHVPGYSGSTSGWVIGETYDSYVELFPPIPRFGNYTKLSGRDFVSNVWVNFRDSYVMKFSVYPYGEATTGSSAEYQPSVSRAMAPLGSSSLTIDSVRPESGRVPVSILGTIERAYLRVSSATYLPFNLLGLEWQYRRSRR